MIQLVEDVVKSTDKNLNIDERDLLSIAYNKIFNSVFVTFLKTSKKDITHPLY